MRHGHTFQNRRGPSRCIKALFCIFQEWHQGVLKGKLSWNCFNFNNILLLCNPLQVIFIHYKLWLVVPILDLWWMKYTQLSVSVTVTHWDFVWHVHISNTRGLCRLLRHRLPTSSQQFINQAPAGEVDRDWPVVFRCTPAHPLPTHGNLCTQCSSYKPEGIHECSTFNFIFIDNNFNGVFKSMNWAQFLLHTVYISVYSA